MTLDDFLLLFSGNSLPVADGDGWLCFCPLHASPKPELRFVQRGKKIHIACLAQDPCRVIDILTTQKLKLADLNGKGSVNGHRPQSPPPNPPNSQTATQPQQPPQKRTIDISIDDLPAMNAESWEAITEQNDPPILFTHGDGVVRTRYDYHDDKLILDSANVDVLRHELSQMADWIVTRTNKKTGQTKTTVTKPPVFLVKDVLASRVIPLPRLNRVVTVPVFAPDGTLITAPGYNKASGVIYAPPRGYQSLDVPDAITAIHLDEARELIEEMICDFPFACDDAGDSADRDNAIALLLLPFVRDMIDGPTPLHLIEASMPGSGKGLLATSLLYPSLGEISGAPQAENDTELRKFLTAKIKNCAPLIYLDNVSRPISSGEMAAALTMNTWDDRILGESETVNAKVRAVWLATGNNVAMSTEIARRAIRIRLTPQTDRPEEREGFKHPDQIEWLTENRPKLVWAAHVICRNAIQQKLPKAKSRTVGSFERWSRLLGSILECAGYSQFLANYKLLQSGSDTEREALSVLAITWYEETEKANAMAQAKGEPIKETLTTSEVLAFAKNVDALPIAGKDEEGKKRSLGKWLKSKHEVITEYVDDDPANPVAIYRLKIMNMGAGRGIQRGSQVWKVELIETILKHP